jgi:hypothetical protein
MSDFLKSLKESLESGKFNSDIAKKINDIDDLADKKLKSRGLDGLEVDLKKRANDAGVRKIDPEELSEMKEQYDAEMMDIKKEEFVFKKMAEIIDKRDEIYKHIDDLRHIFAEIELLKRDGPWDPALQLIDEVKNEFNI